LSGWVFENISLIPKDSVVNYIGLISIHDQREWPREAVSPCVQHW
jgi:hypothetical protein